LAQQSSPAVTLPDGSAKPGEPQNAPGLHELVREFEGERYLLWRGREGEACVVLHRDAEPACVLQAALHAELARAEPGEAASSSSLKVRARELAGKFGEALQEAGWSTDRLVVDAAPARATWTCGP